MGDLICELCPRYCVIPENGAGDCRVRINLEGKLIATTYGRPSAVHIDPMEKKPLYHFHPGSSIFSIATAGCNLHCRNCQNWQLSQRSGEDMERIYRLDPEAVVNVAAEKGCRSIAYTYSEPIVFYEYVYDTAVNAHSRGLHNVLVTAAYINREPLRRLCQVIDATNTDLKGFNQKFYRDNCDGSLKPVLDALVTFREEDVWVEVTHLVIPTLNDDLAEIRKMARWIRDELGAGTPLHISRFHPMYRMRNLPTTPTETLEHVRNEAMDAGLDYVYIGNVYGHEGEDTICPRDGTTLIDRTGYRIEEYNLDQDGGCPVCQEKIPGVWM
ncbi:MAG: AmmeMemoRadiSam system radical SAM enzyme [Gammaproteobacteria bacterium]|nr:AmmeMemoRadiSam system radical SAM enzyme [Gammaproteobacteria bacterium]